MISGDRGLAQGKQGAFYNTLEEMHLYWDRIDIICPHVDNQKVNEVFGNVFIHASPWPLLWQSKFVYTKGLELFKKHQFHIMTIHEYPPFYNGLGAYFLARETKVPYVLEVHHIPGYPKAGGLKEFFYRLFARVFMESDARHAAKVRVVNQHQVPEFLMRAGVPKQKILHAPSLYIDHGVFRPLNEPKEYDMIFVGRLAENKGIDLFISAAKKLGAKALIVGEGSERARIQQEIEGHSNIILHGWAKDSIEIARLMNKSRMLVMPSFNEGGPRVVVEAMACGVPVLATPVGVVPDLNNSCVGIDWNADRIAAEVKKLLASPEAQAYYSHAGIEAAKEFDKKATVQNYAEQLKALT